MSLSTFTESVIEQAAIAWLGGLDYSLLHGPEVTLGRVAAEQVMGRCV